MKRRMSEREKKQRMKLRELTYVERAHWLKGEYLIAGIDEAGRGPLAGPVVAACVIMPREGLIMGVNDSKQLTEKQRGELYCLIAERAVEYKTGIVWQDEIDDINILNAARKAFMLALGAMETRPDHVYTDSMELNTDLPYTSMVKADTKVYAVAAASIIAKVTRDNIMREYGEKYPEYAFESHKGYGTKAHYEAIKKYGVLEIHRKSFLKNFDASREWGAHAAKNT